MAITTRDEEIKKNVVDHLYWDSRVDASNLLVEVKEGNVTISGTVPTLFSRSAAIEDVSGVAGVTKVENKIDVRHLPAESAPDDERILADVQNAIFLNPDVEVLDIDIKIEDGVVTLFGTVDAHWKKLFAENLVSEQWGVRRIQNELAVVPTQVYPDQDIAKAVVGALRRSAFVNPEEVHVEVKDGVVTLAGTPSDELARRIAYEAASRTGGVIDVLDRLRVSAG
jgi:osmotically-inducible protein OsmY